MGVYVLLNTWGVFTIGITGVYIKLDLGVSLTMIFIVKLSIKLQVVLFLATNFMGYVPGKVYV